MSSETSAKPADQQVKDKNVQQILACEKEDDKKMQVDSEKTRFCFLTKNFRNALRACSITRSVVETQGRSKPDPWNYPIYHSRLSKQDIIKKQKTKNKNQKNTKTKKTKNKT